MNSGRAANPITAWNDARVFRVGKLLRATKIDEIPQLFNMIRGDMTIVGPRPEDPEVVRSYSTAKDIRTLQVEPGLTSLGALYYYTHCEARLAGSDVTEIYTDDLLPTKRSINRVYLQQAFGYDLRIILKTVSRHRGAKRGMEAILRSG